MYKNNDKVKSVPKEPTYKYNIEDIERMMNEGKTTRDIAKVYGCAQASLIGYLKRNFNKVVTFVPKGKK